MTDINTRLQQAFENDNWMPLLEALTEDAKGGCKTWLGGKSANGQPVHLIGGARFYVSQINWALRKGFPVPENLEWSCDTPGCVNPDHARPLDVVAPVTAPVIQGRYRRNDRKVVGDAQGQVFACAQDAADAYGVERSTIRQWIKRGKPGWCYVDKLEG